MDGIGLKHAGDCLQTVVSLFRSISGEYMGHK